MDEVFSGLHPVVDFGTSCFETSGFTTTVKHLGQNLHQRKKEQLISGHRR
jgi:hypothetical protein